MVIKYSLIFVLSPEMKRAYCRSSKQKGANIPDLCIETASTAQVLREVHILMCKNHSFTFTHCTDQLHGVVIWAGRKGDRNGQNQSDKVFPAANEEG